ncbi:MAG: hypothetical protein MZV64_19940 [Ignavibacteriales bacterium]|nr:hypothetical protein [Ignavibacteriales bacterium]
MTIDATTDDSFAANGNRPAIVLDGNGLAARRPGAHRAPPTAARSAAW